MHMQTIADNLFFYPPIHEYDDSEAINARLNVIGAVLRRLGRVDLESAHVKQMLNERLMLLGKWQLIISCDDNENAMWDYLWASAIEDSPLYRKKLCEIQSKEFEEWRTDRARCASIYLRWGEVAVKQFMDHAPGDTKGAHFGR